MDSTPASDSSSGPPGPGRGPSTTSTNGSTSLSSDAPRLAQPPKRTRVLLSCAACRTSKLKCDRGQPCGQCVRRGRDAAECTYAPRPDRGGGRPARSMAARLRRLEGMVRGMLDGGAVPAGEGATGAARGEGGDGEADFGRGMGVVVHGEGRGATTYVGATHFMAILDDIEDLKSYFDDPGEPDDGSPEASPEEHSPELFMLSGGVPRNKQDLLNALPPRQVVDRLVMRYFMSNSPSQHIVHRPTFVKQYGEFWKNPQKVPLDWLALLFMILALATFFSTFSAPHEITDDSPVPPMDRFKEYRSAAGWALVTAKYTNPGSMTLQPLMLYVEAEFITNRTSQTPCYLLSSICIRLMLKVGLHRDPSKLANITPFDGEMRRRLWNLAIQIDLLVSFHMGLPSMIHGIESDVGVPRNLIDEDFAEDSPELPPGRPDSEYTPMSYPIWKSTICRVFGLVARQAHSLTAPTYSDVLKLDGLLDEKWKAVPSFMKVRPLGDCIGDPPAQVVQRFGIAALYQKSRCVLHRRYLIEAIPRKEHEYSRRTCLEAALALLGYQSTIHQASQPGGMLHQTKWFLTALAVHDFLLAAMIVYLSIQNERYSEVGEDYDWMTQGTPLPNRDELLDVLKRSGRMWKSVAQEMPEAKKPSNILETMLKRLGCQRHQGLDGDGGEKLPEVDLYGLDPGLMAKLGVAPVSSTSANGEPQYSLQSLQNPAPDAQVAFSRNDLMPSTVAVNSLDPASSAWWPLTDTSIDWNTFDDAIRGGNIPENPGGGDEWMQDRNFINELDFLAS